MSFNKTNRYLLGAHLRLPKQIVKDYQRTGCSRLIILSNGWRGPGDELGLKRNFPCSESLA